MIESKIILLIRIWWLRANFLIVSSDIPIFYHYFCSQLKLVVSKDSSNHEGHYKKVVHY